VRWFPISMFERETERRRLARVLTSRLETRDSRLETRELTRGSRTCGDGEETSATMAGMTAGVTTYKLRQAREGVGATPYVSFSSIGAVTPCGYGGL
jgi:hypothetical protein